MFDYETHNRLSLCSQVLIHWNYEMVYQKAQEQDWDGSLLLSNKIKHHFHITNLHKYNNYIAKLKANTQKLYLCTIVIWKWCLILLLRNHPNLVPVLFRF